MEPERNVGPAVNSIVDVGAATVVVSSLELDGSEALVDEVVLEAPPVPAVSAFDEPAVVVAPVELEAAVVDGTEDNVVDDDRLKVVTVDVIVEVSEIVVEVCADAETSEAIQITLTHVDAIKALRVKCR